MTTVNIFKTAAVLTASSDNDKVELLLPTSGEWKLGRRMGVMRFFFHACACYNHSYELSCLQLYRTCLKYLQTGRGNVGALFFLFTPVLDIENGPVCSTAERKVEPQLLLCSEVLSGEAALRICSSKQQHDRRDNNTNSLITLLRVLVDICSRRHFSFHSGQWELNGPKQQQQQKRKNQKRKKQRKPPLTEEIPKNLRYE